MKLPPPDLSKIRHDLRTPINQIIGYCELLLEDECLPDGFKPDLEHIRAGGRQLLAVISEYFDEAKFDEKRRDLQKLNHDLRTPVNHIIGYSEILRELAEETGCAQALKDLQRIHDAARSWLGLMEGHLLPGHSGDIAAPAEMPPRIPAIPLAQLPSATVSLDGSGKILVVDDDPVNRELLHRRLTRHGYHAQTAGSGAEALRRLRSEPFDLMLLDLVMPDVDGYQVLAELKTDSVLRHIPVLMISGLDQENGIARCIEAGAEDYLTKPFNPTLLRARIGACLEKKRLRDHEQQIYRALVASQKQLAAELAEAGAYVRSLLPEPIVDGAIRADWCFQPSTQLGGDAFGYYWIDDDRFAIYLIDVCGHGVGAALLSVSVMNALRSGPLLKNNVESPAAVLAELNRMFPMEAQNEQYFTAWLAIYQKSTRRLTYASGGHPPAVLCAGQQPPQSLRTPKPPIGTFPDSVFGNGTVIVPPLARLFVFSDGVYEIARPDGSVASLADFVSQLRADNSDSGVQPNHWLATARTAHGSDALDDDYSLLRIKFEE
jgi:sigma-B regulation protein RsbU (phosphoserine phosphatase)